MGNEWPPAHQGSSDARPCGDRQRNERVLKRDSWHKRRVIEEGFVASLAEERAESRDELAERTPDATEARGKSNLSYSLANKERQLHSL